VGESQKRTHHPILVSVLGTYGQWDADLTRGYAVTGTKRSKGETDVDAYSIRARVDWQDAFHVGPVGVSPRLAYTIMHTEIDGYQEDGGSAPANFKDQTHMAKEMRYGLTGKYKLTDKTTLLGHAEGVHRFDTHAARIKATAAAAVEEVVCRSAELAREVGVGVKRSWNVREDDGHRLKCARTQRFG